MWTLDVDVVSLAWLDPDSRAGRQLLPVQLHLTWSDEYLAAKGGGEITWDAGAGFLSAALSGSGTGCLFRMLDASVITTPDV